MNLISRLHPDCAFIDLANLPYSIIDWMKKGEIGNFTGKWEASGCGMYPEFRFNLDLIREYEAEF